MVNSILPDKAFKDAVVSQDGSADARVYVIDDDSEIRKSLHFFFVDRWYG